MKKVLFVAVSAIFFFSCSNDSNSESSEKPLNNIQSSEVYSKLPASQEPCPLGSHPVLSYDFDGYKLHRKSTGCTSRFSICSDGHWEVNCENDTSKLTGYNSLTDKALVAGVLSEDQESMTLHFPIEIRTSPTFKESDFETFGFDENYKMYEGITIKAGEYVPTYTTDEIIVKVTLL